MDRARELSSPHHHQYYPHHNSFRPIVDAYHNSLSARSDIRSPQWSLAAAYVDNDDMEAAWMSDGDGNEMVCGRRRHPPPQPPAYSHSPPQPAPYRRHTPVSPAPILRPDNYTLKRAPRPAAIDDGHGESRYRVVDPEIGGHLLGYVGEPAAVTGGDTTDSGYSLQRSTAPPSPAPLDIV